MEHTRKDSPLYIWTERNGHKEGVRERDKVKKYFYIIICTHGTELNGTHDFSVPFRSVGKNKTKLKIEWNRETLLLFVIADFNLFSVPFRSASQEIICILPFRSVSFRSVYDHFVRNSWRRPKQTKTAFILSNKHWWKLFFIVTSIHFAVPFRSVYDHFVWNSWRRPKQTKTAFILPFRSVFILFHSVPFIIL